MAPIGLLSQIRSYFHGEPEPEKPVLSTLSAITLLVLYTLVYVIPFYLSQITRPSPTLTRDAPSVIRARIRSVTLSCTICGIFTFSIISSSEHGSVTRALHYMGFFPIGIIETVKCLALTGILFLGPLFESGIVEGGWKDWLRLRGVGDALGSWMGWRNIVAGPVTEELLFRSISVPLLLLSQTSNTTTIFLTPIIFGIAHIHHFYEFRLTHPRTPVIAALLRSLFQFTYTTLFGGYVTFLFLRTGSVLAVTLVHSFCNCMGLPRVWGRVGLEEGVIGPDATSASNWPDKSDDKSGNSNRGAGIGWTIAYYVLLVVGAVAWWKNLWTLTESESALTKF
ncbi:hypothetical protein F5884DRAFT_739444 [Xylogone sp. PMI_703]|nr:hypothetical protein F5884DRAFT_739444 [Xylogone sp. PMI_703]